MSPFVGRAEPLARLTAAYQAVVGGRGGAGPVLVTGEAGIGKTALLTRFADVVVAGGGTVAWGTCWDDGTAPAWWPWTQALRSLLEQRADLARAARPELTAIVPGLTTHASPAPGGARPTIGSDEAGRLLVLDAAAQLLRRAAGDAPVVVILDDLHWADRSTVDLLRFVARGHRPGALLLVGAYRPYEPPPDIAAALADLATLAELVRLRGLSASEIADLVRAVCPPSDHMAGAGTPDQWARLVHERSGGHPFYARELCHLLVTAGTVTEVPPAVRAVIRRRVDRLSPECVALLEVAAITSGAPLPEVLAEVSGDDPGRVADLMAEAVAAGLFVPTEQGSEFAHDLYRETIAAMAPPGRRQDLHHRVAAALLRRRDRGNPVFAAELARHLTEALPLSGTAPAVAWAHTAAGMDAARYAFAEAAGHLARLRVRVAAADGRLSDADLIGLLTAEADLQLRGGESVRARELLASAWIRANASTQPELLGTVALGLDRIDARFGMPRTDLVAVLDRARRALHGTGTAAEAQVIAALARQLQHSVPADRAPARPLAKAAVVIARTLGDPGTLASCLLAQHDVVWTPGTAGERAVIATEIVELARRAGDPERHAQALLLLATAQLEQGSPAFRATLAEYGYVTEQLRQPRHEYLLRTRRAALALLDGDIATGDRLSAEAVGLGEAVHDHDTGNVRMSQRIEIVRAGNDPAQMRAMAAEAVQWWIGLPAHAHAVAAAFAARSGDLDRAGREIDTVLALDDWRTDRSYLWSIFIAELVTAAIAVGNRPLCQRLLDDLLPVADTCAVNGALVCFMGAQAHRVGLLHAALGDLTAARQRLQQALDTHRRLGARAWQAESHRALAGLGGPDAAEHARLAGAIVAGLNLPAADEAAGTSVDPGRARLYRVGEMWQASYGGQVAYLRDAKGLHDLAALLARPGTALPAMDLIGGDLADATAGPVLDRAALRAYRRRLAELDEEMASAAAHRDLARQGREAELREALLAELRRATRPDGTVRPLGTTTAERARKAVTARIRDAIRRITQAHPTLGIHLDRTIRTGTTCRYDPPDGPSGDSRGTGNQPFPSRR